MRVSGTALPGWGAQGRAPKLTARATTLAPLEMLRAARCGHQRLRVGRAVKGHCSSDSSAVRAGDAADANAAGPAVPPSSAVGRASETGRWRKARIEDLLPARPARPAQEAGADRRRIEALAHGCDSLATFFVDTLAKGIARLAAVFHPLPAIVRLSDFKTNEYAHLIGGDIPEPAEENSMLGFRGASRYYDPRYAEAFALECQALRRVRETLGLRNIVVMIPFCRTPAEADKVLAAMAANGLARRADGLQVFMMCEIPSNVVLAEDFAARVDGFSIGSNDLTQLVLGIDRDCEQLAHLFDERDQAVKRMIADVIKRAKGCGISVGICGQAPSDHPDFAAFLVEAGIDSISLSPDSFVKMLHIVAQVESAGGATADQSTGLVASG